MSVQGDCDGHTETDALDEGLHRVEVKTVHTPCEAITALRTQRFDCVIAMTPPAGKGVPELAKRVKESFGVPFLFKAPTQCDPRKLSSCLVPSVEHDPPDVETFCPGGEAELTFETHVFPRDGIQPTHLTRVP